MSHIISITSGLALHVQEKTWRHFPQRENLPLGRTFHHLWVFLDAYYFTSINPRRERWVWVGKRTGSSMYNCHWDLSPPTLKLHPVCPTHYYSPLTNHSLTAPAATLSTLLYMGCHWPFLLAALLEVAVTCQLWCYYLWQWNMNSAIVNSRYYWAER